MPFTPELYRMALEMSTPDGWDYLLKGHDNKSIFENLYRNNADLLDVVNNNDIIIPKSLGAKAKNYEVIDPFSGETFTLVEGTHIQNAKVFADNKGPKPLYTVVSEGLTEQHGGSPEKWEHCKGIGTIDYYGEHRIAEVHWFQEESVGKIKAIPHKCHNPHYTTGAK